MNGPAHSGARHGTIALTGATGFLGSHIADRLLSGGWAVRAAVRPTSDRRRLETTAAEIRTTDLTSTADCRAFLAGTAGLIHCAGVVAAADEAAYRRGNVEPTAALLAAAREAWAPGGGTVVLISSLAAHGPAGLDRPAREDDPCRPVTAYGRSKLAAEALVLDPDLPFRTAVLRPPALYGPRDREFLPLLRAARRGWTVRVGRRLNGLSLVDGRDAAEAAVRLLETASARGPYFVDDGRRGYDWPALAAALAAAVGRPVRTLTVPLGALRLAARLAGRRRARRSPLLNPDRLADLSAAGWVCDGSRLTAETGFAARCDAARGLTETLAFYRGEGWL